MNNENNLKQIIEHFGINNQQRKFQEEVFELQEAITIREKEILKGLKDFGDILNKKTPYQLEHIAEEISDCLVLIKQFQLYYGIKDEEINNIMEQKINRTLERIESGYYENNRFISKNK